MKIDSFLAVFMLFWLSPEFTNQNLYALQVLIRDWLRQLLLSLLGAVTSVSNCPPVMIPSFILGKFMGASFSVCVIMGYVTPLSNDAY